MINGVCFDISWITRRQRAYAVACDNAGRWRWAVWTSLFAAGEDPPLAVGLADSEASAKLAALEHAGDGPARVRARYLKRVAWERFARSERANQ